MSQSHVTNISIFSGIKRRVRNIHTYILLSESEYCHVRNHRTGKTILYEGPKRVKLGQVHELVLGPVPKVKLPERTYAIILSPYNQTSGRIDFGAKEIRVGPAQFGLYPDEVLEGDIGSVYILKDDEALLLHAEDVVPHPYEIGAMLATGEEILLRGPRLYIPHKDVRIVEKRKSRSVSQVEGVYVQNDDTGEVRLVRGPTDLFLEQNESLWEKHLTREELQALGYIDQLGDRPTDQSRVLAGKPRARGELSDAVVIDLEDNEVVYLYDAGEVRVVFGPNTVFLGAHERPKVLYLSGGIPVRPNVLRVAKLGLGPDFIRDQLSVRTSDNATLLLDITYRWQFVPSDDPRKLFALKDFVGFVALTLSSEIREIAAHYTFEDFHAKAVELVKATILGEAGQRVFVENDLVVFGVDVEHITPDDPEIAQKLSEAIKTNVDIYTARVQEEARLESERRLIEGRAKNEKARAELVAQELENEKKQKLTRAQLTGEIARADAQVFAETHKTREDATREAEVSRLTSVSEILATEGGSAYIRLEQARVLKETDKVIVPTDSKLVLGVDSLIED